MPCHYQAQRDQKAMNGRLKINCFSLKDSIECGQFFRYTKIKETYIVQGTNRIFFIKQKSDQLYYEGVDESFLTHFFRLDDDLELILKEIDRDPIIHQAILKYRGLRLIRQDPWECLFSFLCSSAKRISHIRSMIELICKTYGEKIIYKNIIGYGFPEPGKINHFKSLDYIGVGFRKDFLIEACRQMDRQKLLSLKGLSYKEARKELIKNLGVGKKIADCVLLYSLDFLEAFPIDTWIKKGISKAYFGGKKVGMKEMESFVSDHFGPYAGYAQLYLYQFWRNHPI